MTASWTSTSQENHDAWNKTEVRYTKWAVRDRTNQSALDYHFEPPLPPLYSIQAVVKVWKQVDPTPVEVELISTFQLALRLESGVHLLRITAQAQTKHHQKNELLGLLEARSNRWLMLTINSSLKRSSTGLVYLDEACLDVPFAKL